MIYISQLLPDDELSALLFRTGAGLEIVDLSIGAQLDDLPNSLSAFQRRLDALGNPPLTLHGPFLDLNPVSWDPLIESASLARYEQSYRAAKALGASKIVFHSCFVPNCAFLEGWAERTAAFYNRFLAEKDDHIGVVMENVFDPSPEPIREAAQRVKHPAFGLCLDLGHAHCYSAVPVQRWITRLAPWIRHLHIHDNCGDRDAHLAPGAGSLPFDKLVALFPREATITIECHTYQDVLAAWRFLRRNGLSEAAPWGSFYEDASIGKEALKNY